MFDLIQNINHINRSMYVCIEQTSDNDCDIIYLIWAATRENLSSGVYEQHRRRPACASAQSDQRLCFSLFGKYQM